jgi:hypothetical protein
MKSIKVTIGKDGLPTFDAVGFNGQGCVAATKPLEDAVGEANKRTEKPEIFGTEEEQQTLGQW